MVQRGNNVFGRISTPRLPAPGVLTMRDMFLYSLFARLALSNNENIEFKTVYNPDTNIIELDVPDNAIPFFNQLTGIQRGENFKTFINWLIGSDTIVPVPIIQDQDPNFISASALSVWAGATQGNLEDNQLVLLLPAKELSVIGYNTKTYDTMSRLSVYLVWVYDYGNNGGFDIKTSVRVTDITTNNSIESSNTTSISTLNLLKGDIRETLLFTTANYVEPDRIVNIMISRNYDGSADCLTDLIGVVGIRLSFDG